MSDTTSTLSPRLQKLQELLNQLGVPVLKQIVQHGEITLEVNSENYLTLLQTLRDKPEFDFVQLTDLCGIDYKDWRNTGLSEFMPSRFAVVLHLLSITHNWRLRVRVFANNEETPVLPSVTYLWSAANWYEREAFDLFGILFDGHNDLRRILTDYGFIGHPFRKDFPVSGYLEMRYDPEQKRVIYQPVTIEPRENVPRVVREPGFAIRQN